MLIAGDTNARADTDEDGNADIADASQRRLPQMILTDFFLLSAFIRFHLRHLRPPNLIFQQAGDKSVQRRWITAQ